MHEEGPRQLPRGSLSRRRLVPRRCVVECHFVEQNPATYRSLRQVLEEVDNGGTLVWEARHGNVAEHLDELLVRAEGVPLFLFLDPFGLGLPFDVIVDIYLHQAPFSVRDTQNLNRIVREFFPKVSRTPRPACGYPLPAPPVLCQDDHLVLFACITPGQPRSPPWRHDQPAADRVPPPPVRTVVGAGAVPQRNTATAPPERDDHQPPLMSISRRRPSPTPPADGSGRIGPGRALPRPAEGVRSLELLEEVLLDAHVLDDSRFGTDPEFVLFQ